MGALNIYQGFAFAENPIVYRMPVVLGASDTNGGTYTVAADGITVYRGRFFPPCEIDISEIAAASVPWWPEPAGGVGVEFVSAQTELAFSASYAGTTSSDALKVLPGGISKQNFRRLAKANTDIFRTRFGRKDTNCLLTTRTASWRIVIPETELHPLMMHLWSPCSQIAFKDPRSGTEIAYSGVAAGVSAIDVAAIRAKFAEENDVLPSVLDCHIDTVFAFRIVVEQVAPSRNRHRLKFRNSYSVFEIVDLPSELEITPEWADNEEAAYSRYDSLTGDFVTERERVVRKLTMKTELTSDTAERGRYIMDALASGEVYLLDLLPDPVKVVPTAENLVYGAEQEGSISMTLKMTVSEDESSIMQDIVDGKEGFKPRIFSTQFSNVFN